MNFIKPKYKKALDSTVVLGLLLVLSGCGSSSDEEAQLEARPGPQASIGISNVCSLEYATGSVALVVETTIIDKTLDKEKGGLAPVFGNAIIQPQQKDGSQTGKTHWAHLGDSVTFTPGLENVIRTEINLCDNPENIDDNTTALNASVSVEVTNSRNTYETSRCDDETKLKVSGLELKAQCL